MIALTEQFVPATDEVWRLQNGNDPECLFFQKMADHGHYGGRPGTRQGIYVCAPSGEFLASVNSNNPDRVLDMMHRGLEAWQKLAKPERRLTAASNIKPEHRWEDSFPADGLVLNLVTRDLPLECNPLEPCEVEWNQDYVWFSKDEARQWVSKDARPGDVHALPAELVERLARLHFVDTVKGQTARFSARDVADSTISTEVVRREGDRVELKIVGSTRGASSGWGWRSSPHGVVTRALGSATYDLGEEAFVEFEMVALGRRWGHTTYNGRRREVDKQGPLGFVFRLAPGNAAPIAPAFIASYDADWLSRPARGR